MTVHMQESEISCKLGKDLVAYFLYEANSAHLMLIEVQESNGEEGEENNTIENIPYIFEQ